MDRRLESFNYIINSILELITVGRGMPKIQTLGGIVKTNSTDKV